MEGFEIKEITQARLRNSSIIFHFLELQTGRNFELYIDHVNKNSITLRLVSNIEFLNFNG